MQFILFLPTARWLSVACRDKAFLFFRKKGSKKLATVPSSYNASASICNPLLDKVALKVNGELLRVGTNVPKGENGLGL